MFVCGLGAGISLFPDVDLCWSHVATVCRRNYSVSMTDYWGSCNLKEEYPYGLAFGLTTRHTSGPFVINLEQRK